VFMSSALVYLLLLVLFPVNVSKSPKVDLEKERAALLDVHRESLPR